MNKLALSLAIALTLTACQKEQAPPPPPPETAAPVAAAPAVPAVDPWEAKFAEVLAGAWRSAENKARDQYRHPKETLMFFGLKPEMTVVEITPGKGWFTEVLAPLVKGQGKLVAAIIDPATAGNDRAKEYYTKNNAGYRDMLAATPDVFGEVQVLEFNQSAPVLGAAASADAVYTFRNVHNWTNVGADAAMFKAFFEVLKPGGVLGVEEHRAAPGTDAATSAKTGYIAEEYVIKLATDAGFQLLDKSEINANAKDTKDYEGGVWTLPPTLREGDTDREKYLAIGESDRMTLLFGKPTTDAAAPAAGEQSDSFEAQGDSKPESQPQG